MARSFVSGSFGGVPMLIAEVSTERGVDVVTQSPASGDKHTNSVRGLKQRRTTCEIMFVDQPGRLPFLERYDAFVELYESKKAQVFVHPFDTAHRALASDLTVSATSGDRCIRVSCVFLADDEPKTAFSVAAGTPAIAGVDEVSTAAAATNAALEELDLESDAPTSCLDTITAWSESSDLDSQGVFLGVASLAQEIDEAIEAHELATDLDRWEAYRQMIRLRYSVVRAAQAFTADSANVFDFYLDRAEPVIAICARIYGASEAEDRAAVVVKNNRIRTPGLVPAGTTLKMPARSS